MDRKNPPNPPLKEIQTTPWMSRRQLFGMVHVHALPGSPGYAGSMDKIVATALAEAAVLVEEGFTGLVIENMHDRPYLKRDAGHATTAGMTCVAAALRMEFPEIPIGVQILAGANKAALAVAQAANLNFVRAEGFVFGHLADEGLMESDAGELLRYRRSIDADHIAIIADIKKKHSSHAISADVSLAETAEAAAFFLADGVVVTGTSTGKAANPDDVREAKRGGGLPVYVGSGVTEQNMTDFQDAAGLIIGSRIKKDGRWDNPIDRKRCAEIAEAFAKLPGQLK